MTKVISVESNNLKILENFGMSMTAGDGEIKEYEILKCKKNKKIKRKNAKLEKPV